MATIMCVENLLPGSVEGYEDLETLASDSQPWIRELFDEQVAKCLPLIDEDFEVDHWQLFQFTGGLGMSIYHDWIDSENDVCEAAATAHRAFFFGLLLGFQLIPKERWGFDLSELRAFAEDRTTMQEFVTDRAHDYLRHRATIDRLISRYVPEISPDSRFEVGAKNIATFALAQVERQNLGIFAAEQAANTDFDELPTD